METITGEEEAQKAIAEGAEVIEIDGRELMKEIAAESKKRRMVMRVVFEVGIPRIDGNVDVITSEDNMVFDTSMLPSKMLNKIKPQLIDTMNKARDHQPLIVVQPKKGS